MPIKIMLTQNGVRISDAAAAALLSPTCRVFFSGTSNPPLAQTCMKYDTAQHQFVYNWKVANNTAPATIQITVTIKNPDGTTNTSLSETITITK